VIDIAFNSQELSQVQMLLAVFGGTSGSVWWDDVELLDTPTLNWLQRDSLPVSAIREDNGVALDIPTQLGVIKDSLLGDSRFRGSYDTYHQPDPIVLPPTSDLSEGDRVLLSGYHTLITGRGQVGCTWNDEAFFDHLITLHEQNEAAYAPDGILLNMSEVRTGGLEPMDLAFATSGLAFANSISRAVDIVETATNGKPIYFWADMTDPEHNAQGDYYQIPGTMAQSWTGLDANKVTIVNWWSRDNLRNTPQTQSSLNHFANLGLRQIVSGFYDEDVADNFAAWQAARKGVPLIVGTMYNTYENNYTQLEPFGELWWAQ